jgi:hypothetical protein
MNISVLLGAINKKDEQKDRQNSEVFEVLGELSTKKFPNM